MAWGQDVPHSDSGANATAEAVTAGIDLSGKTVVVTGCNSGIGLETMRVLALRGAHVVGTARTAERGREACASVEGKTTPVVLELTDFASVVACAENIRGLGVPIDVLICNAGSLPTSQRQVRGLEMQFVVNHLGHYLLTRRLLDDIVAAPQGRVVVVGSIAHRQVPPGGIQFDNLSGEGWERQAYGHSKLANGLFALELSRRLRGTGATSNSLHPGVVATNIMRHMNFTSRAGGGGFNFETPAQGAATSRHLASNRPGLMLGRGKTSPIATRPSKAPISGIRQWPRSCGKSPNSSFATISRNAQRRPSAPQPLAWLLPRLRRALPSFL